METNGEGQRLQVRCSASVLSMIKLSSLLPLSTYHSYHQVTTTLAHPALILKELTAQIATKDTKDGEEPPIRINQPPLLRGFNQVLPWLQHSTFEREIGGTLLMSWSYPALSNIAPQ